MQGLQQLLRLASSMVMVKAASAESGEAKVGGVNLHWSGLRVKGAQRAELRASEGFCVASVLKIPSCSTPIPLLGWQLAAFRPAASLSLLPEHLPEGWQAG